MIDTANKLMLRVAEAARLLGVSPAYLNTLRSKGGGPVYVAMGRAIAYHPDDLERWLAERRRASTSDKGGPSVPGLIRQTFIRILRQQLLAGPWILRRRLDDLQRSYLLEALAAWTNAHDEIAGCDLADFDQAAAARQIAKGNDLAQRAGFGEDELHRAYVFSIMNEGRQYLGLNEELERLEGISDADLAAGYVAV